MPDGTADTLTKQNLPLPTEVEYENRRNLWKGIIYSAIHNGSEVPVDFLFSVK